MNGYSSLVTAIYYLCRQYGTHGEVAGRTRLDRRKAKRYIEFIQSVKVLLQVWITTYHLH